MKRLFFILLFYGGLFLLSCQEEYGILDYQEQDIVAVCRVNEKYTVEIVKAEGECTLTVKEPQKMAGLTFQIGEKVRAVAGKTEIQMDKESLGGVCALSEIFSQSEECLTAATEEGQGSVLTFQREGCTYKLTMGKNSLPQKVHIISDRFEYNVDILSIELKK